MSSSPGLPSGSELGSEARHTGRQTKRGDLLWINSVSRAAPLLRGNRLTGQDAPSRLTISGSQEVFPDGSIQDGFKGNSDSKRSVRTEDKIIIVQEAMVASLTNFKRRLYLELKFRKGHCLEFCIMN
ncbi:hypothetical protein NPIL_242651 [Nephila pilipes]|uniref:Uncharacterized protein n=1 Tax=Nephila pilipes TaxID=299642 RepID=A0A8X6PS62_NEPPI|nr:hypothetical protein NPIL_242651 [Nephila pilipes]